MAHCWPLPSRPVWISARFLIAAIFMLDLCRHHLVHNCRAGETHRAPEDKPDEHHDEQKKSVGLKQVLLSSFGLYSVGPDPEFNRQQRHQRSDRQYPAQRLRHGPADYVGHDFPGRSLEHLLFIVAGRWLARSGGMTVRPPLM